MDSEAKQWVWDVFNDCLPNLCYINRTRNLLSELVSTSLTLDELLSKLERQVEKTQNPSFRTDIKILLGKLSFGLRERRRPTCFL